jgi:hypothetical protein
MTTEITKAPKFDLSTLNPEQKVLYSQLKSFSEAEEISAIERKSFAYLKGRAANALKEITEHSQFAALLENAFPENRVRWLQYCMKFATAVDTGKHAPLKFIPDNRLLKGGELSKEEKEKVSHAIDKVTGDKGIKTVIADYTKKLAREKAKDAPAPDAVAQEREHQRTVNDSFATAVAKLEWVLHWKDADFVLADAANKNALAAICVRFGKRLKSLKKFKPVKA